MAKETETVKTTIELPRDLWRQARVRAAEIDADLRTVVILALEGFLSKPARKGGQK